MGTIYTTIFSSYSLDLKMRIAPRTSKTYNPESGWTNNEAEPRDLVTRHTSKKGLHSLIYNPVISMSIDVKDINGLRSMGVPVSSIHKFASTLAGVYKGLSTPNLYAKGNDGSYVMDKTIAMKLATKFPVYGGNITVAPCVARMNGRDAGVGAGVSISSDDGITGLVPHTDVMSIHTAISGLDVNTYAMLGTLLVKIVDIEDKLDKIDTIDNKVDNILRILQSNTPVTTNTRLPSVDSGLPPWVDSPPEDN